MCFEQWCRFCGSTLFVFWRNVLHCSRMCLYVEAFVWYNVFLVPCFFRFVFGSIDVMFWGRGRPYTATELCLFIFFVPCLFGVVFVPLCLWVNGCYVLRGRPFTLLQNMFVCWSFFGTVFVWRLFCLALYCLGLCWFDSQCLFRCVCGSTDVMFWGRGRPYTAAELSARLHLAPENNIGEKDNGKERILVRRTRHGTFQKNYTAGFSG